MAKIILPSGLGELSVPYSGLPLHLQAIERDFLALARGEFRRLMVSIPIRHGKSCYANLFIAWLLLSQPWLRILRVMASSTTAEMEAHQVIEMVERQGYLTGVKLDKRKCAVSHFKTTEGGELRSGSQRRRGIVDL